jgi:serine/threonine protein kinase/Tfp pilus assembly protein PilF
MPTASWDRAKEIFAAVREREPSEQAALLDQECGDDEALRDEVQSLLAHASGCTFLERPPVAFLAAALSATAEGHSIGPYRILRAVDAGGMGEVYEAEQVAPVQRRVALKLIKRGLDSEEAVARFRIELQSLARMSHPHIAQVYEAGATAEGRPFFAMEYVEGEPITHYCDRQRLDVQGRLALFQQLCEGVQHAHQKGIIHRDLKPENILVTHHGERAFPKIIDFGIARATAEGEALPSPEARQRLTSGQQRIGTRPYMSPEQVIGAADIDTRSDVYSLGVVLYELLVGVLPGDAAAAVEIEKPSSRLAHLGEGAGTVARNRRTEPAALARLLRGDLDWIVMKALERDRGRRYGSVSELAIDLERHRRHEPVLANPPSTAYRFAKFLRRHRAVVAASVLVSIALLLGAVGAGVGLVRARRAEKLASQEAERGNREAAAARSVADFMVGLFQLSDPDQAKGSTVTAREILDSGARKVAADLKGQPVVEAALMDTIGSVYQSLGLFDSAESMLGQSLALRRNALGGAHPEVATSMSHLAELARARARYPQAKSLDLQALAIRERALGKDHPDVADSLNRLGLLYLSLGSYAAAEPCFQRALAIWSKARDGRVSTALSHLALLYRDEGRNDMAIPLFQRALAIQERELGPEHSDLNGNRNNLADIYRNQGRYAEAEALLKHVLAVNERVMGPEHPYVSTSLNNLAMVYRAEGRYEEAEALYLRVLAIDRKVRGENHPDYATSLHNLAVVYREQGNYAKAEPLFLRALAIREKALGPDHPHVAGSLNHLGLLYTLQHRYAEAEPLFRRSLAIREKALGPDHPHLAVTLTNLANLYRAERRYGEAEPLLQRALAIWDRRTDANPAERGATVESYGALLRLMGRASEAARLASRGEQGRRKPSA